MPQRSNKPGRKSPKVKTRTIPEVVEETLQFLDECHLDTSQDFIREVNGKRGLNLPISGLKQDVLKRIRDNLDPSIIPPDDLLDFVDRLKENGYQHIFLFRLSEQHRDYLAELQNPAYLQKQLADQKLAHCYNHPQLIWDAATPQLAAVMQTKDPQDVLLFKWVETRMWRQRVNRGVDQLGNPLFAYEPRWERSVNFFRISLENGQCELGIQSMHPNSEKLLRQEWESYCEQISKSIRFDYFRPVLLEPAIRALLSSGKIQIQRWNTLLYGGNPLNGGGYPTLLQKLGLFLKPFVGLALDADWLFNGKKYKIRVSLDGKTDELMIPKLATSHQISTILQSVRELSSDTIANPELKKVAPEDDKYRAALKKLDIHLSQLGEKQVHMKRLMEDEWLAEEEVIGLSEEVRTKAPKVFHVTYQVFCPKTNRPIGNANGPFEYPSLDKIPENVECEHPHPRRKVTDQTKVTHQTKGNVKPILLFQPPSIRKHGWLEWAKHQLGSKTGSKATQALFKLIFIALFSGLALIIAYMFLLLIERFQKSTGLAKVPFLIVMVLLIISLMRLFGPTLFERAVNWLKEILIMAMDGVLGAIKKILEIIKEILGIKKQLRARKGKKKK